MCNFFDKNDVVNYIATPNKTRLTRAYTLTLAKVLYGCN